MPILYTQRPFPKSGRIKNNIYFNRKFRQHTLSIFLDKNKAKKLHV